MLNEWSNHFEEGRQKGQKYKIEQRRIKQVNAKQVYQLVKVLKHHWIQNLQYFVHLKHPTLMGLGHAN